MPRKAGSGTKKVEKEKDEPTYEVRDIVLGKVRGFPAWPGIVVDPKTAPEKVTAERPGGKKAFHLVRFFPTGDYSWLLSKDISKLQSHEISSFISSQSSSNSASASGSKKKGELLKGYEIAQDPTEWEAEKKKMAEEALAALEAEGDEDADGEADEDELMEDEEGAESGSASKGNRKRKRDSDGTTASGKKKPASSKKDKTIKADTIRKSATAKGTATKKGGGKKKSKEMVADSEDGEGDVDPDHEAEPPTKKVKKGEEAKDEEEDPLANDPEAVRVKDWRSKVQKTFLPSNKEKEKEPTKEPKVLTDSDLAAADKLFTSIEQYDKMTVVYLQYSKIGKVMRHIAALPASKVPKDPEYNFRERAKGLVDRWQGMVTGPSVGKPDGAVNGVNVDAKMD